MEGSNNVYYIEDMYIVKTVSGIHDISYETEDSTGMNLMMPPKQ